MHVGLADDVAAGIDQRLDHGSMAFGRRLSGESAAAASGHMPGDVEAVLDRNARPSACSDIGRGDQNCRIVHGRGKT